MIKQNIKLFLHPLYLKGIKDILTEMSKLQVERLKKMDDCKDINELNSLFSIDLNKRQREKIKMMTSGLPLTRSYKGLMFDHIFNMSRNHTYYITHPDTRVHLYSALKYQLIGSHELLDGLSKEELLSFLYIVLAYLLLNVHIGAYYKTETDKQITYSPLTIEDMENMINTVYDDVYTKHNYTVYDVHNDKKQLDITYIKHTCIKEMKRFQDTELKQIITDASKELNGEQPTVNDLVNFINNSLDIEDYATPEQYFSLRVDARKVRYYLKMYELEDLIKRQRQPKKTKEES